MKLDQPVTMLKVSPKIMSAFSSSFTGEHDISERHFTCRATEVMVLVELPRTSDGLKPPPANLYPTLNTLF